ncbi:MAG TPA: ATP-dependent helicase [Dissulfurispiraceae bacterium]|nr:ATP-dependent helicase [Dissulfurispiraceae bacterium]
MTDLHKRLNAAQYEAVTTVNGPLLVIAGAGSGKTRVIEYRVFHLVQQGIIPGTILLLTFTRRAAREMLERAARHDPRCKDVEGGTFHSFAYRTLKRYANFIGLPTVFTVLDEGDAEEAVHICSSRLGVFDREKRFPKKDTLKGIISMSINRNMTIGEVLKRDYPHFLEYAAVIEDIRERYTEYKIEKNYLDYDDLLLLLRILLENDDVRDLLSRKYHYIMVDEYQDTNALQGDITYLLGESHRNVMAVGDDAQSIYGFRGASHENIMDFPKRFPECKVITLAENYRSTQAILNVANTVLEGMTNKYSKCLVAAKGEEGVMPQLLHFKDAYEEADWVAGMIKRQMDEGMPLHHQAVLFRSSFISIPLQAELSRRNIPYITFGGLKFYETAHVKDVMAHLKVIDNPRDELSWNRALMLLDGVGPRITERILGEIMDCRSLEEVFTAVFGKYRKGARFSRGIVRLENALKGAYGETIPVGEQFEIVLRYYEPFLRERFDDWHLRRNDLETLRQVSMRYRSIEEFLLDFAIEPPERGIWAVEPETPEEEKPVVLSTIHSAKGLEWDAVFVVGLMDGVLPVGFALDSEEEIEEEHRLFYVAVTRAKKRLFLSLHHQGFRGGITQFHKVSRFIDTPEVRERLQLHMMMEQRQPFVEAAEAEGQIGLDKGGLLKKITDYFRKEQ